MINLEKEENLNTVEKELNDAENKLKKIKAKATQKKEHEVAKKALNVLGVYPQDMKESFERQLSTDALAVPDIPGFTQHFVNPEARSNSGRNNLWKLQNDAEKRKIGDLLPAFAPTELVNLAKKSRYNRGLGRLKKEEDKRRYEMEKLYRDTNGSVQFSANMNTPFVRGAEPAEYNKGTKTYFHGK